MPRGVPNTKSAPAETGAATERKTRVTVTPLEKAQNEAVRAYEKLTATREEQEAIRLRFGELERLEAYQERLLGTTQLHPDLPEGFNVVEFLKAQEEALAAGPHQGDGEPADGAPPHEDAGAVTDPAVQSPEQLVATNTGEVVATAPTPAPAADPDGDPDDPFAGL